MSSTVPSADAKAVVRAIEGLSTQVRRVADILTTPVVEYEVRADDDATTPATTCSAQYRHPDPVRWCIRAGQHQHPMHTDDSGFSWPDTEAVYPVETRERRRSPMDPLHILGAEAPAADEGTHPVTSPAWRPGEGYDRCTRVVAGLQCVFRAGHPPHGCTGSTSNPGTPTDEDAQRTERRASLRNLLDRADRNHWLLPDEARLLREHVEAEVREGDTARAVARSNLRHVKTIVPEIDRLTRENEQLRAGRETWKRKGEEIERDRDRIASELEELRVILAYEHKRANDAITREETAEQAAEEQRRRADIFETELRVLREGLRANGADPTQIQNLWAQIRLRNRQWREAKGERDQAQAATERVRRILQDVLATFAAGAAAGEPVTYLPPHRVPLERFERWCAALDGTEQPSTEA